ncbi:MAG: ATPase [Chloroflexi bacterium]|nr:ATPase [Chloroflexota bacterium]
MMDIQQLVDRLEELIDNSRMLPLSVYRLIEEDKLYNLIDQMRVTIPEEVKRANRVEAEKDRVLAQAHEEADRILDLAKQEAEELVKRDAIVSSAQQRSDNILERSHRDAEALRSDADLYVIDVLTKLEEDLLRSLAVVRNGMRKVQVGQEAGVGER